MPLKAYLNAEPRGNAALVRLGRVYRHGCIALAIRTDRGKWSKDARWNEESNIDDVGRERARRPQGPEIASEGYSPPSRWASQGGQPRSSTTYRNAEAAEAFKRGGTGFGASFRAPATSMPPPPGNRRSEQERAARKAARVADKAATATRNSQGCCYGCGAPLQTDVPAGAGYVPSDKYVVKKQRRQLDKVLCARCSELCNGAMIPAVQDFTQKLQLRQLMNEAGAPVAEPAVSVRVAGGRGSENGDAAGSGRGGPGAGGTAATADAAAESLLGKVLITPEQLRAQLTTLSLRAAVVVLLVDLLDASGSLMARVRDMVGRNPIVLVGTKMDLMPQGCRPRDVAEWLEGAAAAKRLNVVSLHLVSSHTGEGMSAAVSRICRERKSRDVYVVGAANVGKSAFVRAMLREMARTDPVAGSTGKYLPVESAMPGTTLGLIPLRAFSGGGILYDTPGVHLHHRIPHMLTPPELKLLHPRRRLAATVPPLPLELTTIEGGTEADLRVAGDDTIGASGGSGEAGGEAAGEAGVRRGRGGLKIVDYDPTDEHGMPITGLDAGVRRTVGGKVEAGGRSAARGGGGSVGLTVVQQQQAVRATYMWSDLVRVDVLSGPPSTALVFYGPSAMRTVGLPYIPADQTLQVDYNGGDHGGGGGGGSRLLVCTDSVGARGGLQPHELVVRAGGAAGGGGGGALADVAVSGLPGWISVWAPKAKRDVRLRVWAPRGVEVMLRPTLPCPPPLALERAWRGGREGGEGGEGTGNDDEEPAALDEWSRALADGAADPTLDPAWWEAMAALRDEDLPGYSLASAAGAGRAARGRNNGKGGARAREAGRRQAASAAGGAGEVEDGGGDDEDLPDWDDEAEVLEDEDEDDGEERVVVTARVEDILKRPRLDVLSQMDLELAAEDEDEDVAAFTLKKPSAAGLRRRDGPAADGAWDPLAGVAAGGAAAASTRRSVAGAVSSHGSAARAGSGSAQRRAAAAGRGSDVAAAEGEAEEVGWVEEEVATEEEAAGSPARRRGVGRGSRRRLGRRREAVQVALEGEGGGGGDRAHGEVA